MQGLLPSLCDVHGAPEYKHAHTTMFQPRVLGGAYVFQVATPVAPGVTATSTRSSHDGRHRRRQVPTCKLDRLPVRTLKRVVPLRPTPEKYLAYFGQTPLDRRRKMINFLGGLFAFYWAAFFATRNVYVLGPGGINAIAWRGVRQAGFIPRGRLRARS